MESDTVIQTTPDQLSKLIDMSVRKAFKTLTKPQPAKEYYTRKEVAELLKCHVGTIDRWVHIGKLNAHAIGNRILFKVDEVHNSLVEL